MHSSDNLQMSFRYQIPHQRVLHCGYLSHWDSILGICFACKTPLSLIGTHLLRGHCLHLLPSKYCWLLEFTFKAAKKKHRNLIRGGDATVVSNGTKNVESCRLGKTQGYNHLSSKAGATNSILITHVKIASNRQPTYNVL